MNNARPLAPFARTKISSTLVSSTGPRRHTCWQNVLVDKIVSRSKNGALFVDITNVFPKKHCDLKYASGEFTRHYPLLYYYEKNHK